MRAIFFITIMLSATASCTTSNSKSDYTTASTSVEPGSSVTVQGETVSLYKGSLKIGDRLSDLAPGVILPIEGTVSIISFVPSIDTPVCEEQTHVLGETANLNPKVTRITVSRDLPMAQQRFAAAARLENIKYVSDYKTGSFGKGTGLMMKGRELLARGVIVTDKNGIVRYFQVVPEITELPDMDKAIAMANDLANQ